MVRVKFIFASFSKEGSVDCAIETFRLVKIKSTNKSELFLIIFF